jgi:hypothetical protein
MRIITINAEKWIGVVLVVIVVERIVEFSN